MLTCNAVLCNVNVVNALVSINKVNLCRARLALGWVSVWGLTHDVGRSITVYNQSPRSTQPGHPSMDRFSEYQPKGRDALRLGSKDRYGSLSGWQVKLCDPLAIMGHI